MEDPPGESRAFKPPLLQIPPGTVLRCKRWCFLGSSRLLLNFPFLAFSGPSRLICLPAGGREAHAGSPALAWRLAEPCQVLWTAPGATDTKPKGAVLELPSEAGLVGWSQGVPAPRWGPGFCSSPCCAELLEDVPPGSPAPAAFASWLLSPRTFLLPREAGQVLKGKGRRESVVRGL